MTADAIRKNVAASYGAVASRTDRGLLDTEQRSRVAQLFGYSRQELAEAPGNQGLSCGNPVAHASLQKGETVLDLGCGAGFDVFLAAERVGASGRVIGVDMSPEMLALAKKNAARKERPAKIEWHLAVLEALPLEEGSVDCAISNCVMNLVPEKRVAIAEAHRVLKPGGRLAISDVLKKKELPVAGFSPELQALAQSGCLSSAVSEEEYLADLKACGFRDVEIVDKMVDMNVWKEREMLADFIGGCCCGGDGTPVPEELLDAACDVTKDLDLNEYVGSAYVFAAK